LVVAARLPLAEVERVDAIARQRGDSSRAAVVRDLVRRGLQQLEREGGAA
jgi:metal-responsive CopG/Arc/MetJ family transcriptional regulator